MGRFASDIATLLSGTQRRQVVTLTASNPSVPIPSWAQGGKGIVRVTGCGAGGGGAGGPGASGAVAWEHPLVIPPGITTLAAVIGAGGAAGVRDSTAGATGGHTAVSMNAIEILRLGGGQGGNSGSGSGNGGVPMMYGKNVLVASNVTSSANVFVIDVERAAANAARGATAIRSLGCGMAGFQTQQNPAGQASSANTEGTPSPFGANGNGYGYGGAGSSNSGQAGQAGGPGFLVLEFVEGL
ncbi:MAG TPA: hypothetical protein VEY50_09290 [Lysobacter sp.]|nr:hypothetical protein [Lysobacter sp.]